MSKHFAYLTQHDEADFFQKVASDQAESRMPLASTSIMKTAMQNLLEGMTFEKVAARLDRDIYILKTAGASGMNLGMQKRANAYIDQLVDQCEMTPEEFDQIFEKVAGEAIMGDLVVAQAHLSEGLDDDGLAWLNGELTKIGAELTELALMEKEAFLGALRAIGGGVAKLIGRAGAATGRGVATAAKGVANLPGKAISRIRDVRVERGISGLAQTKKNLDLAQNAQRTLQVAGRGGGLRSTFNQGKIESLQAQAASKKEKLDKLIAKQHAGRGITADVAKPPPIPAAALKPKASATATAPKAPTSSTPAPKPDAKLPSTEGADAAAKAANPPAAPKADAPPPTVAKDTHADDLNMNVAKGEGATLKGAWGKMRDGGWKSLDGAEKQKLINAGLATVVGGRVITGHGILTGGEGII